MIEAAIVIGLLAAAWGSVSPDRLATPARSAVRSGASAGARSAWTSTKSAWTAGQPTRSDRAKRGRSKMAGWRLPIWRRSKDAKGNRTGARRTVPIGRGMNRLADGAQSIVGGAGRTGWSAMGIGWSASRAAVAAGREGWRDGRENAVGWRAKFAPVSGRHCTWTASPSRSPITVSCGRTPAPGDDLCGEHRWRMDHGHADDAGVIPASRREYRAEQGQWRRSGDGLADPRVQVQSEVVHGSRPEGFVYMLDSDLVRAAAAGNQGAAKELERRMDSRRAEQTPPPAGGGDTTPKENPVPTPTGQLDVPNITALQAVLDQLAKASEIAVQMAGHSATSVGLPDALAFDAGGGVRQALDALAEVSPDPKALAAWAEQVHYTKRAVDRRAAELADGIQDAKGTTDQLAPS